MDIVRRKLTLDTIGNERVKCSITVVYLCQLGGLSFIAQFG